MVKLPAEEILEGVMDAAEDDFISMVEIIYFVKDEVTEEPTLIRDAAAIAAQLVVAGEIFPGNLTKDGFIPWPITPREAADRILADADAWAEEGREVHFGSIAWFDLPRRIAARAAGDDPAAPRE